MWLVHPDNAAMQLISERVAVDKMEGAGHDGYDLFFYDR